MLAEGGFPVQPHYLVKPLDLSPRTGPDPYLHGLPSKARPMVERRAGLGLPLMRHSVHERFERVLPPVPPDVASGDRDLGRHGADGWRVVPEPALHAARDSDSNWMERAAEALVVQPAMLVDE